MPLSLIVIGIIIATIIVAVTDAVVKDIFNIDSKLSKIVGSIAILTGVGYILVMILLAV